MKNIKFDILFLAPLPPPITGQSLISASLLNRLKKTNKIKELDLSIKSNNNGELSFFRTLEVFLLIMKTFYFAKKSKKIYLTISESLLGNIKDILLLIAIYPKLNKTTIHLHGGSINRTIFKKYKLLKHINNFFYKRLSSIIILGKSHKNIFPNLDKNKLCIINNFVPKDILISKKNLNLKNQNLNKIRILYMSMMTEEKGYKKLFKAYKMLSKNEQEKFFIDFAGGFRDNIERERFISEIKDFKNINYQGIVKGKRKRNLFHESHIFILPTTLFEGQPLSILEAYASGCIVLTTKKPGIKDIFEEKKSGFFIEGNITKSISRLLSKINKQKNIFNSISTYNFYLAKKNFSEEEFFKNINYILKI